MKCKMMMEDECWVSFNVVGGETGITAYDLLKFGKFHKNTEKI